MSSRYFITNLCHPNPEMNGSCQVVHYRNSNSKTGTSVHNNIKSIQTCSCSQQHSLQIDTIPIKSEKKNENCARSHIKQRSRSSTPKKNRSKSSNGSNNAWSTIIQSTSTSQKIGDHAVNNLPGNSCEHPVLLTSSTGKIPNSNTSRTLRSCSCVSAASAPSTLRQRSVIHTYSMPTQSRGHEHILCASEVVSELRNDLEHVKSQLDQIVDRNSETVNFKNHNAKQLYQMKSENKKLKKELEQKKLLYQSSTKQIEKLKDILNEYEHKVTLLHQQAVKSSKVMKQTKEKFCTCLKEKENVIKQLKESREVLQKNIEEKENQYTNQRKKVENLENDLLEKSEQNSVLSDTNQNFCECIKMLETQLENSLKENSIFKKLEQAIADYKCNVCQKLEVKIQKQKDKYESRIKELEEHEMSLREDITKLTNQVQEVVSVQSSVETLERERNDLQSELSKFEHYASKCKILEEDCQKQCQIIAETETKYNMDREQLQQLIDELTNVVKENKMTLIHLSEVNKKQETLLLSQSDVLLKKEEELMKAGNQMEILRKRSNQLEEEISEIKSTSSGPCANDACVAAMEELEQLRADLVKERDNQLLKGKIIEDQSMTISHLQNEIKEKTYELNRAREDSSVAEEEMIKVNDSLIQKNMELEKELHEKKRLNQKLRKLEYQKSTLSNNLSHLEKLVEDYCSCQQYNEEQRRTMDEFQKKVVLQKHQWEAQTIYLAREKDKAVRAAKFATQKLIDTVEDFQKEVNAQKKVQVMLTKMLHDKEEELQNVKERISSINSLSNPKDAILPIDELFRSQENNTSEPTTTVSYSSWSNSSKYSKKNHSKNKDGKSLEEVFEDITRIDDEPIRDY